MKDWVGLVGWPVADGLPTIVVSHQLQVECRTGKVHLPETDVLLLCHAAKDLSLYKLILVQFDSCPKHIMYLVYLEVPESLQIFVQWQNILSVQSTADSDHRCKTVTQQYSEGLCQNFYVHITTDQTKKHRHWLLCGKTTGQNKVTLNKNLSFNAV